MEIVCTILSGIFAIISAIFGGISIRVNKKNCSQSIVSGNDSKNVQIGEINDEYKRQK